METNQSPAQEPSVQPIAPENPQHEPQPIPASEQSPESCLLYDPAKAVRIAECLRELLDPAFIVLFGLQAGGTPHSETVCYDLLVIVESKSHYNWYDAKRYLKMKLPNIGHGAPYLNIYVLTKHDVEANFTPFIYLSRREGILLYRSHGQKFKRPRKTFDFGHAAAVAEKYTRTFLPLADQLLLRAEKMTDSMRIRQSAFAMAQVVLRLPRFRSRYIRYCDFATSSAHLVGRVATVV